MENKFFSILTIGFVINSIVFSFFITCYSGFIERNTPLTHIKKGPSVINITGY